MSKLMILLMLLTLAFCIGAEGCGGEGESTPVATAKPSPAPTVVSPAGYATFTDNAYGFFVDYPADWDPIPEEYIEWYAGEMGVAGFWAPVACEEFVANFNIVNEELPFSMSVNTYFDASKRHLRELEGYQSISEEEIVINSIKAVKHHYAMALEGEILRGMQIYFVKDETGWVLTYTSAPGCWQQYEPVFDHMTGSFQFLD